MRISSGKPKEACGVFGLYSCELEGELAQRTYFGLYALQHRGQESAGIAVSDGERTTVVRDMGLVSQVRREEARLAGVRSHSLRPRPLFDDGIGLGERPARVPRPWRANVAAAHNGNLVPP